MNLTRTNEGNRIALQLTVRPSLICKFSEILQKGFAFKSRVGISIESFLCEDLSLNPQYVQERLSTIFLNGNPVDSIESALLREGATLALSSAMPGLAGATLRRNGLYASLRASITYKEDTVHSRVGEGMIVVKLFNLLIEELGPLFLERGIILKSSELQDFLLKQRDDFRQDCRAILLEGTPVDYGALLSENRLTKKRDVELVVIAI